MKNLFFKINESLRENKMYYSLILLFFFVGIVLGVCTIKYMNDGDKKDLLNYFDAFIRTSGDTSVNYFELIINVTVKVLIIIVPIVILGFTFFGVPFILIIDLIKGFTLGYTFAFLVNAFGGNGFLMAICVVIPQNLFYIPAIIGISTISIKISSLKFKRKFLKSNNHIYSIGGLSRKIMYIFLVLAIGILIEVYVSPSIIKLVIEAL